MPCLLSVARLDEATCITDLQTLRYIIGDLVMYSSTALVLPDCPRRSAMRREPRVCRVWRLRSSTEEWSHGCARAAELEGHLLSRPRPNCHLPYQNLDSSILRALWVGQPFVQEGIARFEPLLPPLPRSCRLRRGEDLRDSSPRRRGRSMVAEVDERW